MKQRKPGWPARWLSNVSLTAWSIVVALIFGGAMVWDATHSGGASARRSAQAVPAEPVSIDGAHVRGSRDAKIALIEYSEFECPYCGQSAREVVPQIERQYVETGRLLLVWRHHPLAIHKHARKASEAAECAAQQGRFWEFHDWAFQHQRGLDEVGLRAAATVLGLDAVSFGACLDGQTASRVQADVDSATEYLISGTPTWFIGVMEADSKVRVSERLLGARPFVDFQKAIDQASVRLNAGRDRAP